MTALLLKIRSQTLGSPDQPLHKEAPDTLPLGRTTFINFLFLIPLLQTGAKSPHLNTNILM